MGKKKVRTPAEQRAYDEKMKAFWSRYKTYEGPRGSEKEWRQAAGGIGTDFKETKRKRNKNLELLGLETAPKTLAELNKARRTAMKTAHPDVAGENAHDLAVQINAAYDELALGLE